MTASKVNRKKNFHPSTIVGVDSDFQALLLIKKKWNKTLFPAIRKALIAKALNHCSMSKGHKIYAYLITDNQIVLVLHKRDKEIQEFLEWFQHYFHEEQKHYLEREDNRSFLFGKNKTHHDEKAIKHLHSHFECKMIYDTAVLANILSAEPWRGENENPFIDGLAKEIAKTPYCSVWDYQGAISPVHVTVTKKWIDYENINN
ncbi:MAG: hypothetical protein R2793_00415 [Flavobacteriaceae bacterium]